MQIRVISAGQVQQLLPMAECVEVVEAAMVATSAATVSIPPRRFDPLIDGSGALGLMPGSSAELGTYGAKVISLHPANASLGLPTIQGFVALFDHSSGSPIALIEGASLTAMRTAAASGVATRLLARKEARSCGLLGTGVQAVSHIDAMLAVRPIERFTVWGRSIDKARAFATAQADRIGLPVNASADPAEAGGCDIVCTVTASAKPVLMGDWVANGSHINLVGSHSLATREADSALISRAALYVDSMTSCRDEGGDFMIPLSEGAISQEQILGEIGQLVTGRISGRSDCEQVTVYNSLGITSQDLFTARRVYDRAVASSTGAVVDL